jgi:hypothetical protein
MPTTSSIQPISGYFTLFNFVRGKSLEELEKAIGYRKGRLSAKGALLFRLQRLPLTSEFEVRGYSQLRDQDWKDRVAPERSAELARTKAIYARMNLPDFDEQQKRNALETMELSGENTPVKVVPLESLAIDSTPNGYVIGSAIPQWTILKTSPISAELFHIIPAGLNSAAPWKIG